jgi:hypothetical protein
MEVRTASIIAPMEAIRMSETSVYFNETTRRYIPEYCHLQYYCGLLSSSLALLHFPLAAQP